METSPRIARLLRDLSTGRDQALAEFWRELAVAGTPLVERVDADSALVTFLWRGEAAQTVTGWGVDVRLTRVPGTDLWYGSQRLPSDLCTLYYLRHGAERIPGDARGTGPTHVDPLNHHPVRFPRDRADPYDQDCWASLLELPAAPADRWSRPRPGVPRGTLLRTTLRSRALGGHRRIAVHRPAGRPRGPLPVLVVFDGHLSHQMLRIPTIMDNLLAAGRVPPTVTLFVTAPSGLRRFRELRPGGAIRTFVLRELLPWAQRRWQLTADPRQRVIAGSSLGGLAAAYLGLTAPETFGGVLAQSGSFWWPAPPDAPFPREPEWLTHTYAGRPARPVRWYLDVGDRETHSPRADGLDQLAVNRRFRDMLLARGHEVTYAEYRGAHDYVNWRRTFPHGIAALLGAPARQSTPTAVPLAAPARDRAPAGATPAVV
ncbi:alpha/beta hydrolase-fold protein [Plantactinospora sp. KBS50]|uniref:alpha/beta hydrolase-fold protein n=1 Tax=Plantactinospora sp. KBS50 TaxID=2024580 RepID=UPI000BAAA693|nr:alpha/beta hydrolase-fold protein [Plantactinospora sp. KBS50]ASW54883.1 hypothetical protein CIK06_12840 [Plantactinospora sp. KBS50]